MKPRSYEEAGVSISRGDTFAARIAALSSPALGELGGFAGGLEIDLSRYRRPVLLSATDGVGTKLLVARSVGDYRTVGIDLVAMCVNDLAVCGAEPAIFLDYIACGHIEDQTLQQVIQGIVTGCELAGCTLAGGETAELPDMYGEGDLDLAGFAVGLVEHDDRLPRIETIGPSDRVVGLASSGIHSNGFSLARKVLDLRDERITAELLTPTRIYVDALKQALPYIKAAAHITGGGLEANVRRVLPKTVVLDLSWDWDVPPIFERIRREGVVPEEEMRRVFNMGIGIAMVVGEADVERLSEAIGEQLIDVGSLSIG